MLEKSPEIFPDKNLTMLETPTGNERKRRRGFSPVYLAILSGILLIILFINGLLEINRTRNGFYLLLEREALVLIQHFEKNVQDALRSFQEVESAPASQLISTLYGPFLGLDEAAAEYLLEAAHRIDRIDGEKPQTHRDLESFKNEFGISSIEVYDPAGNLLRSWPAGIPVSRDSRDFRGLIEGKQSVVIDLAGTSPPGGAGAYPFSVAIQRRATPGIIRLSLGESEMKKILRHLAVRRAISDIGLREGILFVSVQDASFHTLAHTDPNRIGTKEEDEFIRNSLRRKSPASRRLEMGGKEEIFEVVKPFSLNREPSGLIRVGFSPKEIRPILRQIEKNVALSLLFFLILGVSAVALIWVNQNRHLMRMRELEDRIRLTDRLSSLGHLAAGVAHEIRNPLNAIGLGLQRLRREFSPAEELKKEEFLSFTEIIYKEIRRVNDIIEQFLTLSRPFQLNLRMASLKEVLEHLTTLFREEASSQGITIILECAQDLPLLNIDAERLTQAFVNIMKNGIQAMESGGALRIATHPHKDRVEVDIWDTGPGIPPDQMEKIFNYYYTTKEKGAGLGLPLAHRIIEAHNGQLRVESRVGVGTRMIIILPIGKG